MARLKITLTIVYDANPDHYGETDPKKMASIDEENFRNRPDCIMDMLSSGENVKIAVEPLA